MIDPLLIEFDVECAQARTFELWTARTSTWWPISHTVSTRPDVEVVIEPRVGGRIFERTPEGEEHEWGEVTAWEPPRRLSYRWHLRQDRADATDVEITFATNDREGTRVSIVHAGWERLGAGGANIRERNEHGWTGLLDQFKAAASEPARVSEQAR